jgi:uncharacterized protein GlcG (DUF336 family)
MRPSLLFAFSGAAVVISACSSSETPERRNEATTERVERVGRQSSAVINGMLDTTHPAVVAILLKSGDSEGLCSGTIVKVDATRHIGWVATAAHCVDTPPIFVLQGADFSDAANTLRYDVIDYKADSRWSGSIPSDYDLAVIRIAGVDASTPTIPLVTSPDGLTVGKAVVSVGFGRTSLTAPTMPEDQNTQRWRVAKQLSEVGSRIAFTQSASGICQGDSGGPVIVTTASGERVAGIHSYVEGDCDGTGVSCRVTTGASFFATELTKALPADSCDLCEKIASSGNGLCITASKNCQADPQCGGYYQCLVDGGTKAQCLTKFPKAEGPFNAAANCTCTQACTTQCKGTFECVNAPKCGYKLPAGACTTCTESGCCDEALACASDGTCYLCLKTSDAAAECKTNAARKAMATCVANKCKTECAGSGLDTGAEPVSEEPVVDPEAPVGGGGGTTTTTTTEGCSIGAVGVSGGGGVRDTGRVPSFGLVLLGLGAFGALARVRRARARARRSSRC